MSNCLKYVMILLALVTGSSRCVAANTLDHDTVFFYNTWEQMLTIRPVAMYVDPLLDIYTINEIYVDTGNEDVNAIIRKNHLAMSVGDSLWLVNSDMLREDFKGVDRHLNGFVPVFFNDKTAFVTCPANYSIRDYITGEYSGYADYEIDYFYIDFQNRVMKKITSDNLSELLEEYYDLRMRYEGTKDYKKRYVIQDYFFKFIDRYTEDLMKPYVLDLVE